MKGTPSRIAGIDMARALAIVGMLAVHMGPIRPTGAAGELYATTHGRASVLFMLVAGVGVALLAASRSLSEGQIRGRLMWRALLLLPLGLLLQPLDHNVVVILQQYAVMFLLAIAVLPLRDRLLLVVAGASATLGTAGFLAGRVLAPATYNRAAISFGDPPGEILHGLLLSGPYPLITWAAPFVLGIWLGRRNLRLLPVQLAMIIGGAVVAVLTAQLSGALADHFGPPVGWRAVISNEPHSQMPLWMIGSMGSAAMVLGLSLLAGRALRWLVWPLVALGQLALSVYVAHLIALHFFRPQLSSNDVGEATVIVLAFTAAAALMAMAWRAVLPRGPLESLFHPPWEWLSAGSRRTDTAAH